MKLKNFEAKEVYGYLKFDIDFHDDLSFLVGVNGSGKTTVIRLIQALLTPSIRDLIIIPFSTARVSYENDGEVFDIQSTKTDKAIQLKVQGIEEVLSLPPIDTDELDFIMAREGPRAEMLEEYQLKYADHEVFQFISKINAPVFLGLERTHRTTGDGHHDSYMERERWVHANASRTLRGKRIVKGSLAAGLMETQALVQEAYRRLRRIEDRHSDRLRESILLSAFRYHDFTFPGEDVGSLLPDWMEQRQIQNRKTEIEEALRNIGISGDRMTNELEDFFGRLNDLFSSMSNIGEEKGFPIEWLINKAQIDRVSELIKIIDDHRSMIDKLYSSINTFLSSVNAFYADTGKSLQIDTVGQLSIQRPDESQAPIEALSSGERQLLIIFSHLLFNEYGSRSNVFIIDEPELSLHLKWQDQFVTRAIAVSPETQLIMATHSPEIIAGYENHSITV